MDDSPEKKCAKCGRDSPDYANFCVWCGSGEFVDSPPAVPEGRSPARPSDVALNIRRVALLTVVSSGLYFFYWVFVTWAQLKAETRRDHYPGWHTLAMLVPIYGLFRLYRHIQVIKSLTVGTGARTNLSPMLCVVLFFLGSVVNVVGLYAETLGLLLALNLVNVALNTTLLVWAQGTLNTYWRRSLGPEVRPARYTASEFLITGIGALAWVSLPFSP